MNRPISLVAFVLLCGGVGWLACQDNFSSIASRRLRGYQRALKDSPEEKHTEEKEKILCSSDGGGVAGTDCTEKDIEEIGMKPSAVEKMVKSMGVKKANKVLHALAKLHDKMSGGGDSSHGATTHILLQILFGVIFFFLVATKFPDMESPNDASKKIMQEPTVCRIKTDKMAICCQALCFPEALLAKIMKATKLGNYWCFLVAGACFPCCTVFVATQCCNADQKLGGPSKGLLYNAFEACCCSCCLIAQATEALDEAVGWTSGCCSAAPKGNGAE